MIDRMPDMNQAVIVQYNIELGMLKSVNWWNHEHREDYWFEFMINLLFYEITFVVNKYIIMLFYLFSFW